jgi:hypothetical protein
MVSWHKYIEEGSVEQEEDKILISGKYRHIPSPGVMNMEGGFTLRVKDGAPPLHYIT